MNIVPINSISFSRYITHKNNPLRYKYNLPFDSVSFSGKKNINKQEYSQNTQEGIAVGKKILKNNISNYEEISQFLNEKSSVPINVDSMENIPGMVKNNFGKVIAHMLPMYTPDFKLAGANIYLGTSPYTSKEKSDFAANIAHEYTHVLQRAKDENYYGVLKYTQEPEQVIAIARASKSLMDKMCAMCQQKLFANEREARMVLDSIINNKFDIKKSLGETDFNKEIEDLSKTLSPQLNKNEEDIKNAIKGWIIQEAQNETEAYSVTLEVLECSKHDPNVKASRTLSKEIYSYINNSLTKDK